VNARTVRSRHLFLSCGEASGDRYGAALIDALRAQAPTLRFTARGGDRLAVAGADLIRRPAGAAVMGIGNVLTALPALWRMRREVWRHLATADIDLVIPVDFPGFNMRVAGEARRRGRPVFYLVAPQMWAWGGWRLRGFRARIDRLGTILPFETEFFGTRGFDVFAMGHPLIEDYRRQPHEASIARREARIADPELPLTVGLIPGSRPQEIERLVPVLKVTALMVRSWLEPRPVEFVLSAAPGIDQAWLYSLIGSGVALSEEPLHQLLPRCDLALVCSGTASLEVALAGVPHEIIYRASGFDYAVARRLLKTRHIGLANLILPEPLVREHTQDQVNPNRLAHSLLSWLNLPAERRSFYGGARRLYDLLGAPGVWRRTAAEVITMLDRIDAGRR
jgi:lipid-A-disaccharide synthase